MDLEGKKFGFGPRELGGAVDLINEFKLRPHHELFCKRAIPSSLSETHYLQNVVGDTKIRKGEGMELDQLLRNFSHFTGICTFDLDILREAFRMRDLTPIDLPPLEKGLPVEIKSNSESKDKKRKQRKHRGTDHIWHKHCHKDNGNDENIKKNVQHDSGSEFLKQQLDKKRRHDESGDLFSSIWNYNGQLESLKNLGW
ncbi:Mediator of RNA polymerase II transcription subunit 19a like [Melia azedarach]|uniref:Mediator of RNA polymerase II transcription subunit 19a like n=2 Tax=Melia azedarach TaxID=155640 RepID=A0ACC1WV32_MELAZ|nr:Mediator of RNA polymerase II transcription subunit 19a like [Melia azedarach]KAJ4703060.1 Mediator of RNA polymerase II transcription subunit 19a like [Melia azedarach]